MHNHHTLFILHTLTYYDFLRFLLFLKIWIISCNFYHQYNQYSYPNIEANLFEARFLKRVARLGRLGSSFLAI